MDWVPDNSSSNKQELVMEVMALSNNSSKVALDMVVNNSNNGLVWEVMV